MYTQCVYVAVVVVVVVVWCLVLSLEARVSDAVVVVLEDGVGDS